MILHGLDIDTKATADNVRRFLTNDLQRYLQIAGTNRIDLKSPQITGMPKGSPVGNTNEQHYVEVAYAESVVCCVSRAISNCRAFSNAILTKKYIDGLPDWKIAVELQYSFSRYKDLKRIALCEFADRYLYQTTHNHIDVNDLHVYK